MGRTVAQIRVTNSMAAPSAAEQSCGLPRKEHGGDQATGKAEQKSGSSTRRRARPPLMVGKCEPWSSTRSGWSMVLGSAWRRVRSFSCKLPKGRQRHDPWVVTGDSQGGDVQTGPP